MNSSHIREAQIADAEGLASCLDAAYAKYADHIPDLPAMSDDCAGQIADNRIWVAVEGARIIGCVILAEKGGVMQLANLAVHPEHRGKGLGQALIARAEREAQKLGFSELHLNTHIAMPENVRLYSRLGWKEITRSGHTVSMKKSLERVVF